MAATSTADGLLLRRTPLLVRAAVLRVIRCGVGVGVQLALDALASSNDGLNATLLADGAGLRSDGAGGSAALAGGGRGRGGAATASGLGLVLEIGNAVRARLPGAI